MQTITKNDIALQVHMELGLNKTESKELVEMFFESIRCSLETGSNIRLSGFGNFILRDKKSRPGRNPKTGEEIFIESRRVVTFKSSNKLKETVSNYIGTEIKE